jgi:hypothetical protein
LTYFSVINSSPGSLFGMTMVRWSLPRPLTIYLLILMVEVADNTWRAGSSELNNTEDSFIQDSGVSVDQRKMNAVRAYFEWMPIRQVEMGKSSPFPARQY